MDTWQHSVPLYCGWLWVSCTPRSVSMGGTTTHRCIPSYRSSIQTTTTTQMRYSCGISRSRNTLRSMPTIAQETFHRSRPSCVKYVGSVFCRHKPERLYISCDLVCLILFSEKGSNDVDPGVEENDEAVLLFLQWLDCDNERRATQGETGTQAPGERRSDKVALVVRIGLAAWV